MSPRSPKQYEKIREEKKNLIMDSALEYFAREGYHVTTISHIAKHAGISKGLMYNYFESKEDLLNSIIQRSVSEVYDYFDINRDGQLSEDEFEFFVRKIAQILKKKQTFWRLFIQMLMQNEVREQFLRSVMGSESLLESAKYYHEGYFISTIMKVISDYFERKKETRDPNYDPQLELSMFLMALKGFAVTYIYSDQEDEYYEKCIDYIIALYK
jgi:AcrR family transcriptional regulator